MLEKNGKNGNKTANVIESYFLEEMFTAKEPFASTLAITSHLITPIEDGSIVIPGSVGCPEIVKFFYFSKI